MASKTRHPLQSLTREQFWQQHIKHWQSSGFSKMRYCRENELPYHQMIYWCEKHRQWGETRGDAVSSFVAVSPAPAAMSNQSAALSIELPNGICITGVDAQTIALVPQLLRSL